MMKIAISTNKFLEILKQIKKILVELKFEVVDINKNKPLDIYDASFSVAKLVSDKKADYGIIIDEFGNGGFIIASKFKKNIVAQLADEHSAHMTREHNNANIITLGAELTAMPAMESIIRRYLATDFAAGRHMVRIDMLDELLRKEEN